MLIFAFFKYRYGTNYILPNGFLQKIAKAVASRKINPKSVDFSTR